MMLFEETTVPAGALPVQALKDHLRLGSGFADDGLQDGLIEGYLRAALSTIEGRTAKVLLSRRFRLSLNDWRDPAGQAMPVAPVTAVVSVTLLDAAATAVVVPQASYRLLVDSQRPKLVGSSGFLPNVPTGGTVDVVFDAGFAASWSGLPADLAQAVLLLAAEFYENRHDAGLRAAGLPAAVLALIERWRRVRVLGGGGA